MSMDLSHLAEMTPSVPIFLVAYLFITLNEIHQKGVL